MSAPVDVLAVMQREVDRAGGNYYQDGRELIEARAAVAELIDHVRSDRCFCHGDFVCTRCLVLKRVGAVS